MWLLLAGALAALQPARRLALLLLAFAVGVGFYQHVLTWPVLPLLAGTGVLAALRLWHPAPSRRHRLSEALLVVIAVGLFLHLFPGFANPRQVDEVRAGAQSVPFSFSFNFDKALVPFVLLAALPTLFRAPGHPPRFRWLSALALIAAVPLLLGSAVLPGGLAIEPHFPPWLGAFVLANLFFISLAEEALFRGYLQQRLREALGGMPALLLSALLFGLAHAPGGVLLVIFATLAGGLYGLAWHWSGRLWLATLLHFALNLTHLLLFTYPALQH